MNLYVSGFGATRREGMIDSRYEERRRRLAELFEASDRVEGSSEVFRSPSGMYSLETARYSSGKSAWGFSRGVVTRQGDGEIIADVRRNYARFWHAWVGHPNGNEYLLCGEDYQGYSVVNLTKAESHIYFPDAGYQGSGFCWSAVYPSPDGLMLAVDGCCWACPYKLVFYDFRSPDLLPLGEVHTWNEGLLDCEGWQDSSTFLVGREAQVRKRDGALYDSLPDDERDRLDREKDSTEWIRERVHVRRPEFACGAGLTEGSDAESAW